MWSSSDPQGGYPTQWMLNPSSYQNMATEEVDWASLAQQWIKMKESFPAEQVPPAPPPPPLGSSSNVNVGSGSLVLKPGLLTTGVSENLPSGIEGGEAPMEMDTKEDGDNVPTSNSNDTSSNWGSWNNWQQWGWGGNWSGSGPGGGPSQATHAPVPTLAVAGKASATVPPSAGSYPFPAGSTGHNFNPESAGTFDFNHSGPSEHFNQQGFWMGGSAPYIREKGDWRQEVRHASRSSAKGMLLEDKAGEEENATPVIDAAKRKQLPAWIREGLEKMEKEKLKKQEREQMAKQKELELVRQKELQIEQQEQTNPDAIPVVVHSKFDSDSDDDVSEDEGKSQSGERLKRDSDLQVSLNARKSRFEQKLLPITQSATLPPPALKEPTKVVYKTKEEIMQDTMKKVRIVLTDILMTVTSEELAKAASEMLTSMRAKAPAKQIRKTPALTSLTGKLGLGIYNSDDDDSASSDEESDGDKKRRDNGIDSDEELKIRCQRRKQEFSRMEGDIISKIEELEERERQQLLEDEAEGNERDNEKEIEGNKWVSGAGDSQVSASAASGESRHQRHHGQHDAEHQVEAKQTSSGIKRAVDVKESRKGSDVRKRRSNESPASNDDNGGNDNENDKVISVKGNSSRDKSDDSDDGDSSESSDDSSSESNSSISRSSRKRGKYSSSRNKSKRSSRNSTDRGSNRSHKKRSRSKSRSRSRDKDRDRRTSHRKSSHDSYSRRNEKNSDRQRKDHDHSYRGRDRDRGSRHERSTTRDRDRSQSRDSKYFTDSYRYHRHSPSPHRKGNYSSSSSTYKKRRTSSSPESVRSRSSKRSSRNDRYYDHRRD